MEYKQQLEKKEIMIKLVRTIKPSTYIYYI